MAGELHIGRGLKLPFSMVTGTTGILSKKGAGKALALDTPLPTSTGWTTMGDIQEGDTLFDEVGNPCRVTCVNPVMDGNACYEVQFSDGTAIVADSEHLWFTESYASRRSEGQAEHYPDRERGFGDRPQCKRKHYPGLVTTHEMASLVKLPSRKWNVFNHAIPVCGALQTSNTELPIDPYTLGAWLGDGTSQNAYLTTADDEVLKTIAKAGYKIGPARAHSPSGKSASYRLGSKHGRCFHRELRLAGLLGNKHVSTQYLRASEAQRLALLSGLMDTDGTIGKRSNSCAFDNTNKVLVDAVAELVVSLGWVARRSERVARLQGKDYGTCYKVTFRPSCQIFHIARKAARLDFTATQSKRHARRMVTDVVRILSEPVRCIAVDSPNNLFLAGKSMVPTHNTYTAKKIAEEMMDKAHAQVVIIDPLGAWWGLKSSADGKKAGFPVVIIGGEHRDIPLNKERGEALARFVVEKPYPVIIDTSELRKGEERHFMTDFAETLYHLNKEPLHLIVDEADRYAPQKPLKGAERLLGAFEDIVRRGRIKGIGVTLISQRSSVINKNVLTQIDALIALRTTSPQDKAVIDEWIKHNGTIEERNEVMTNLASLEDGECYFWSPMKPKIFMRTKILPIKTFDSSATPEVGKTFKMPDKLAEVDMAALREEFSGVIEAAEQSDPKYLVRRVAELESELAAVAARPAAVEVRVEKVEVPIVSHEAVAEMKAFTETLKEFLPQYIEGADGLVASFDAMTKKLEEHEKAKSIAPPQTIQAAADPTYIPMTPDPEGVVGSKPQEFKGNGGKHYSYGANPDEVNDAILTPGPRKILQTLANYAPMKMTKPQLGEMSKYSWKGGTFQKYFGILLREHWVAFDCREVTITPAGFAALGQSPKAIAMSPEERRLVWLNALPPGPAKLLNILLQHRAAGLEKWELGEKSGYKYTGGTFQKYLGILRRNDLVYTEYIHDVTYFKPQPDLFAS